jgi:hypothetical protein
MDTDGRFEIRWKDGQVEIAAKCSRRAFAVIFSLIRLITGGPELLTAVQQVVASLG